MPDTLGYWQSLPENIPFVDPPTSPAAVKPEALPVQGGDEGVGQVGSVDVPLGGSGNGNGASICVLYADWEKLVAHECVPKVTPAQACGTLLCTTVQDDCNIPRTCRCPPIKQPPPTCGIGRGKTLCQ